MKTPIALAVSLLLPLVSFLADTATAQDATPATTQAGDITSQQTAAGQKIAQVLQSGTKDTQTTPVITPIIQPTTPPATIAGTTASGATTAKIAGAGLIESAATTRDPAKNPSSSRLGSFVSKHPILSGAIAGGILGAFAGPGGMVLGAVVGGLVAWGLSYFMKKK